MVNLPPKSPSALAQIPPVRRERHLRWRRLLDFANRYLMGVGGIGVIAAITLIFFYLVYVTLPLFVPASVKPVADYPAPAAAAGRTLDLAVEEQNTIGLRLTDLAHAVFFNVSDGTVLQDIRLPLLKGVRPTSFATGGAAQNSVAYGLSNGEAILFKHQYSLSYPDGRTVVSPALEYPLGASPVLVDPEHHPLRKLAVQLGEDVISIVALTDDGRLVLASWQREENLFAEQADFERSTSVLPAVERVDYLLMDPEQTRVYAADADGTVTVIDISDKTQPRFIERVAVLGDPAHITALRFLIGGISLLVGTSTGEIQQWFPVRDSTNNTRLTHIRSFAALDAPVTDISVEQRRKGFSAVDAKGELGLFHTTAGQNVFTGRTGDTTSSFVALSPRANAALTEDGNGRLRWWRIHNEHPEVSWSALWRKTWYETYPEPQYVWQSSSASNDFEPKFSLTPLAFGTLKAAFYAMLFSVPLALMGAVFAAYFMAPRMRAVVKPTIEIMEALPTVILGFLAGLWLAPMLETHLAGIFSMLLLMPAGVLGFALLWRRLPGGLRRLVPEGWQAALLIPVLLLLGWISFALGPVLEAWFFGGDLRLWLSNVLGLPFDQRNALVVGLAMGVAVIPTIFSIAEDAIFSVPKHLSFGSLALGATPWQTLTRVVILTASPGIFSAVMIGLGRAVGETMIVLMATGNTPVMDLSIFQGMRTLSANVAVELPESEVGSTHYRILFLAALVLFLFTFLFNTIAEIVRQRLRRKYSSL